MADLAALGGADAPGLTIGPGGHVVVEQEVPVALRAEGVEKLVHAWHGHGADVHHLGLATLEKAGAVGGGKDADLTAEGPQVARAAAVDALALLDDALAHQLLGEAANGLFDFTLTALEGTTVAAQLGNGVCHRSVGGRIALGLAGDGHGRRQGRGADAFHRSEHLGGVILRQGVGHGRDRAMGGDHACHELTLEGNAVLDPDLAGLEAAGEGCLIDLRCAIAVVLEALGRTTGLDHHDRHVAVVQLATGNHELEGAVGALLVSGVGDPFSGLGVGDAGGADGTVEGDTADHQRRRGGVDRDHVVGVLHVGTEDGEDHLDLVTEPIRESRPQGAVGEAAGEDGVFGGATFATEERTGDLARGVGTLFDIDGEGQEVGSRPHVLGRVGRGENSGATEYGHHGTLALLSQLAGLERQGLVGTREGHRHSDGVSHDELLSRRARHAPRHMERRAGSQSTMSALNLHPKGDREPRHSRLTTESKKSARLVC